MWQAGQREKDALRFPSRLWSPGLQVGSWGDGGTPGLSSGARGPSPQASVGAPPSPTWSHQQAASEAHLLPGRYARTQDREVSSPRPEKEALPTLPNF